MDKKRKMSESRVDGAANTKSEREHANKPKHLEKYPNLYGNPNSAPRCGAKTRKGRPCRAPAVRDKKRCRMHGGAKGSGAPKGNRNAQKSGIYSTQSKMISWYVQRLMDDMARRHVRPGEAVPRGKSVRTHHRRKLTELEARELSDFLELLGSKDEG